MSKIFGHSNTVLPAALALALPVAFIPQVSAQALSFRLDFTGDAPDDFRLATQAAADTWSSLLKDDVVVDLRFDYTDLSAAGSVLGGAQPAKVKVTYSAYVNALFKDAISGNDFQALSSLPLSAKGLEAAQALQAGRLNLNKLDLKSEDFSFLLDGRFGTGNADNPFVDFNGSDNNQHVLLTNAQARALGLANGKASGLDGLIKINNTIAWDFDQSDGVDADKYDLTSVLQHEIAHALGIVSGVDTFDFLTATDGSDNASKDMLMARGRPGNSPVDFSGSPGNGPGNSPVNFLPIPISTQPGGKPGDNPVDSLPKGVGYATPLDFYRYSQESADLGVMDLTVGGSEKYFSLDGGESAITDELGRAAYFSTGSFGSGGDGYQASHWKVVDGAPLGIMTPLILKGQSINISQLDLTLLDAVGWNLQDKNADRAAALGFSWAALVDDLASDRQAVIKGLNAEWGSAIPQLEAALGDASTDLEWEFQRKLQEKFDKLADKLAKGKGAKNADKKISKFYQEVSEEADKRNHELRKLPNEIYKRDLEVRQWLSLSVDELADKLEKADPADINRLSNIVKFAPAEQRAQLEPKLAEALAQFANAPDKLLQKLLDSSGPANPVGWAHRWGWWWQVAEAEALNINNEMIYATGEPPLLQTFAQDSNAQSPQETSTTGLTALSAAELSAVSEFGSSQRAQDSQAVPEPSSVLATFGMAALGAGLTHRQRLSKGKGAGACSS